MTDVSITQAYKNTNQLPDTGMKLSQVCQYKFNKYKTIASLLQAKIQPLVWTTFGAFSPSVIEYIKAMEKTAIINKTYFRSLDRRFAVIWRENLSFSVARYTAQAALKAAGLNMINY